MTELETLQTQGFVKLENLIESKTCKYLIKEASHIYQSRVEAGSFVGSLTNILLYSPFFDSKGFMDILLLPKIHRMLRTLIDDDFTLMHYVAVNRSLTATACLDKHIRASLPKNVAADKWHVDSRYNNNRRLGDGFSFILIIALDNFTIENATQVVPLSHLCRDKPNPFSDYNYQSLTLTKGDAILMDSGLWHRGGNAIEPSRWGIHLFFAPWFVKPYYDYPARGLPDFADDYSAYEMSLIRKLLHYNSTPPESEVTRIKTVIPYNYEQH